jgi:osmotically-inducible protein OsmY
MKATGVLVTGLLLAAGIPAWGAEPEAESTSAAPAPGAETPTADREEPATLGQPPAADPEQPATEGEQPAADADKPAVVGKERGAGQDLKLEKEIRSAFEKDADLKNNRITVIVDNCNTDEYSTNCNVTLVGAVDNQSERMKAEQLARVKGVVVVDNLLDLGEEATDGIADGAVTAKVREQLLADKMFKNAIISITTTDGVVTLVGIVPSEEARRQAGEKARKARAVKRVENALRVDPELELAPARPTASAPAD